MPAPIACQDADRPHVVAVGVWPSDLPAVHVIDWVAGSLARPCMLRNLLLWMRVIAAILNDLVARHHRGDARGRRLPSRHFAIAPLALAHGPHDRGCGDHTPHERLEPNLICGVCKISNGYKYILERNLQVARLLGASIELLGASLITGNSSSISSFSSNSELAILLEYHYPTIHMTTLQPYSPYPRYGGSMNYVWYALNYLGPLLNSVGHHLNYVGPLLNYVGPPLNYLGPHLN